MEKSALYLEHIKNSREFILSSRLRQSLPFRLFRHYRFRDRLVRVQALGEATPQAQAAEVTLLGVWYEDFPHGMPLELTEHDLTRWRLAPNSQAQYEFALVTNRPGEIYVYSNHENLQLKFAMNPGSGKISVEANGSRRIIDLYSPAPTTMAVFPNKGRIETVIEHPERVEVHDEPPGAPGVVSRRKFTAEDARWLERLSASPRPVSLNNPDWRGILSSALEMFDEVYQLPDELDAQTARYYADLFQAANLPSLTIQGFPRTYRLLVRTLRKQAPGLPIYVIYHGNLLHMREDYDWTVFNFIKDLHQAGDIQKVGFVKQGMAELMTAVGMDASFIYNLVRRIPSGASMPDPGGTHVAVWGQPDWSWKKSPYAMLGAVRMIPGVTGHVYNVSPRAQEVVDLLGLKAEVVTQAVPHAQVVPTMQRMHLNLYVSLTECAPMMPLEGLSVGSPCLFGPTTYYFQDHEYLHSRLVVPYPDEATSIARCAIQALEEREAIIRAYAEYAPGYNRCAFQALSDFLQFPMGTTA
ncbi:MAG: hypothetical protein ACKOC5_09125 [Chloroflexota bacterium]